MNTKEIVVCSLYFILDVSYFWQWIRKHQNASSVPLIISTGIPLQLQPASPFIFMTKTIVAWANCFYNWNSGRNSGRNSCQNSGRNSGRNPGRNYIGYASSVPVIILTGIPLTKAACIAFYLYDQNYCGLSKLLVWLEFWSEFWSELHRVCFKNSDACSNDNKVVKK